MSRSSYPIRVLTAAVVLSGTLLPALSGCGQGEFPVSPAKGKVVCNGQPVTVGSVTFSPIGAEGSQEVGKPATAVVGPDGTFTLTTNHRFDGAVIGKHRVQYTGPEGEEGEESEEKALPEGSPEELAQNAKLIRERHAQRNLQCVQKGEIIMEVKADGENDFTIELTLPGR